MSKEAIRVSLRGKVVIVTGGTGFLGLYLRVRIGSAQNPET